MNAAYIIGEPGAGKSSIVRALTEPLRESAVWLQKPFGHIAYLENDGRRVKGVQLGGPHPKFPGTDTLSMSVQPKAIEWLQGAPAPFVFGEGDRLATQGFFEALERYTEEWALILVEVPREVSEERRAERGSQQNETWLKGRLTKLDNLEKRWHERMIIVENQLELGVAVDEIRNLKIFKDFLQ